ncbi:MAG: 2,3-bisphosphoglycerate-dependent phosphoglycerate mutase, partial [Candidatus Latescibacterota bacterium]
CNQPTKKAVLDTSDAKKVETTTYYLIRHAEKDRSDPTNKDPKLTEEGLARAKKWADYFDAIPLDQIYSTSYLRTQQTSAYTATRQNLMVEHYEAGKLYKEDFKTLTKGQKILIVGHSNTTPALANKIIGQDTYADIKDGDNASLYKVTIEAGEARVQVLKID